MSYNVVLETQRLLIRPWTLDEEDRRFFHHIMSNETGRRFYPSRRTREEADKALETLVARYECTGPEWMVATLKSTGQRLGFTGLAPVTFNAPFLPAVEIGWQYDPAVWGNGYATEAAGELQRHGFEDLGLAEIVAFAVPQNVASTDVMRRIGMSQDAEGSFDHPDIPESKPDLKRHVLYRIDRAQWRMSVRQA